MSDPISDFQNWIRQLFSGKKSSLFGVNQNIPENSGFNAKFDKVKDFITVVKEETEKKEEAAIEQPQKKVEMAVEEQIDKLQPEIESTNRLVCANCKNPINEGDLFCMNCGIKLNG